MSDVSQPPESPEPDPVPQTDAPERPDSGERPRIGVDEWVAQVEQRRERYTGVTGWIRSAWERLPPAGRLAIFVVPAAFFPLITSDPTLFRYGIFTLI